MQRRIVLVLTAVLLTACGPRSEPAPGSQASRAQKDSAVARSGLPGAKAVDRALGVVQAADARTAALDSIH